MKLTKSNKTWECKEYNQSDWGIFAETPQELVNQGYGKQIFVRHTFKHKVRIFFGMRGSINSNYYFFGFMNGKLNTPLNFLINLIPVKKVNM